MKKRYCTECGCILDAKHDGDICEVCLDDMELGEEIEGYDLEDQLAILLGDKEV